MNFTDMDMLQDYEKDTRMAALAYTVIETDIIDPELRKLIHTTACAAVNSQRIFADFILKKGDRP